MDIKNLSELEYKYLFNIPDIIEAKEICHCRKEAMKKAGQLEKPDKNYIDELSEDLELLLEQLITRKDISTSDDYDMVLKTAILANSQIQTRIEKSVLQKKFGKIKRGHPLYADFQKWRTVYLKMGAKGRSRMFFENHSTSISYLVMIFAIFVFGAIAFFSRNIYLLFIDFILFVVLLVATVVNENNLEISNYIDHLTSMKNNFQYRNKNELKLKSTLKEILELISLIWKK